MRRTCGFSLGLSSSTKMKLHEVKEEALLSWINIVFTEQPVRKIIQIMEGNKLLKVYKRMCNKSCEALLLSPFHSVLEVVLDRLQEDFHFCKKQAAVILKEIVHKKEAALQLSKVLLVICYCGFKKNNLMPDLDMQKGLIMTSMLNLVKDTTDGLSLDKATDAFLTKKSVINFSCSSSERSNSSSPESPVFYGFQRSTNIPLRRALHPGQGSDRRVDNMSSPLLWWKRNSRNLEDEECLRAKLDTDLANKTSIIPKKDRQISRLMLREHGELEKNRECEVLHLQEKSRNLLYRVAKIVKRAQDLEMNNAQEKHRLCDLTDKLQTLSAPNQMEKSTMATQTESEPESCHQTNMLKLKILKLQGELKAAVCVSSEKQQHVLLIQDEMKKQQLKFDGLRTELERKVEMQNSSLLAFKNVSTKWVQQNEELLAKLKIMSEKLVQCSSKNQELQERNKFLERSLEAHKTQWDKKDCKMHLYKRHDASVDSLDVEPNRLPNTNICSSGPDKLNALQESSDGFSRSVKAESTRKAKSSSKNVVTTTVSLKSRNQTAELDKRCRTRLKPSGNLNSECDPNDLMRIAELQRRNQTCLPHLKSCYPIESKSIQGLTDEVLRAGDPKVTMLRKTTLLQSSQHPSRQVHKCPESKVQRPGTPERRQRRCETFTIPNTPKVKDENRFLHRGLKRQNIRVLQSAVNSTNRSPQAGASRTCPRSAPSSAKMGKA